MRLVGILSDLLAVGLAALAVYTAGFGVFDNAWFSGLIVALAVAIALLRGAGDRPVLLALHGGLALLFAWLSWVWLGIMLEQEAFFIEISRGQLLQAWLAIAVIAYVTWREFGLPMLLVGLAAAAWLLLGAGEDWARAAENLWYSTDGVYGRPVEVVGRIVLVFIVFGAVLQTSGAGAVLLKMAFAATARFTGGAAHASIVASALFGTLSGAAVANVVSTGVFTIPIIKRAGFRPRFAGAVEAAASTGGQIMPPVMGVVAFLMADVTNIPYLQIVVAATIPALMYYASLFVIVAVEARRLGIAGTPPEAVEPVTASDWVKSLAFFLPLVAIVVVLVDGRTPQFAGAAALVLATVLSLILFPAFRHPRMWWQALVEAGRTSAKLMVIVAAIGFVIGVINMTGIGLMFAQAILRLSDDSLFLSLLLVMLGCLVMGMGVPSAPAYLIVAIVMGPALERLGVPTIGAAYFFYFIAGLGAIPFWLALGRPPRANRQPSPGRCSRSLRTERPRPFSEPLTSTSREETPSDCMSSLDQPTYQVWPPQACPTSSSSPTCRVAAPKSARPEGWSTTMRKECSSRSRRWPLNIRVTSATLRSDAVSRGDPSAVCCSPTAPRSASSMSPLFDCSADITAMSTARSR